jgi:hypothetical protein
MNTYVVFTPKRSVVIHADLYEVKPEGELILYRKGNVVGFFPKDHWDYFLVDYPADKESDPLSLIRLPVRFNAED